MDKNTNMKFSEHYFEFEKGKEMTFNQYQELAASTAVYPEQVKCLYPLLGLFGECAETIEKATSKLRFQMDGEGDDEANAKLLRIQQIFDTIIPLGKEMEVLKKDIRKNGLGKVVVVNEHTPESLNELEKELGDELWYQSATCKDYGLQLDNVAIANYTKLADRQKRNVLTGSGDNR